jgi:hypothetical protein
MKGGIDRNMAFVQVKKTCNLDAGGAGMSSRRVDGILCLRSCLPAVIARQRQVEIE